MYDGYDPLYIPAGMTHMDGELALKYARTRHQDSDYDRAYRQQQVIFAIRDKILSLDMAPQLVSRAPALWEELSGYMDTGLTLDQIVSLAWYARDIPRENIRSGVIDRDYVIPIVTTTGACVSVPDRDKIGGLISYIFNED